MLPGTLIARWLRHYAVAAGTAGVMAAETTHHSSVMILILSVMPDMVAVSAIIRRSAAGKRANAACVVVAFDMSLLIFLMPLIQVFR